MSNNETQSKKKRLKNDITMEEQPRHEQRGITIKAALMIDARHVVVVGCGPGEITALAARIQVAEECITIVSQAEFEVLAAKEQKRGFNDMDRLRDVEHLITIRHVEEIPSIPRERKPHQDRYAQRHARRSRW